jgi:hypothetical protein
MISPFSRIFISRQKKRKNIDIFMNVDLFGEKHPPILKKISRLFFDQLTGSRKRAAMFTTQK